jgi:hypothetical protein
MTALLAVSITDTVLSPPLVGIQPAPVAREREPSHALTDRDRCLELERVNFQHHHLVGPTRCHIQSDLVRA